VLDITPPASNRALFDMIVATTNEVAGYRFAAHLGLCRSIYGAVPQRPRQLGRGAAEPFGGRLSISVKLAERARQDAYDHMVAEAGRMGADAVVGMRYDANEIMDGITEVLAYGTAVRLERLA
jgi:uncharacterized protein YbjQ (UPF0145 family)